VNSPNILIPTTAATSEAANERITDFQGEIGPFTNRNTLNAWLPPGALRSLLRKQKTPVCRPFMELAGLEPATSWVRFRSAVSPNPLHKRASARPDDMKPFGYPALARGFWG
jgi:hypothetical protein